MGRLQLRLGLIACFLEAWPVLAKGLQSRSGEDITTAYLPSTAQTYFREPTAWTILYGHIGLMLLAWVGFFPIFVTLDLARSNFAYPAQILFLGLNALGTVFGLAYNSRTQNLYPGNVHHTMSWALTGIAVSQFFARILRSYLHHRSTRAIPAVVCHEEQPLVSSSRSWNGPDQHLCEDLRFRAGSNPNRAPYLSGQETGASASSFQRIYQILLRPGRAVLSGQYPKYVASKKREFKFVASGLLISIMDKISTTSSAVLMVMTFVNICTGLVTMAGIFHGKQIFNGLAHFIKGGVIFGFGVITLWRWMGRFSGIRWAWNLKHVAGLRYHGPSGFITMEGLESSLIFFYGISNVFLEHLSAWGEDWVAQDFEHVAISVLFIGGGLCGIMIEYQGYGRLAKKPPFVLDASHNIDEKRNSTSGYSINPINPLIILLLGKILGGHEQANTQSTMMHQWVGSLLTGASAARCLTYIVLYLAPPTSISPPRTPSESITSFCLMTAGIMLMASNRDTIDAMIMFDVNAIVVATMAMSVATASMAWCMALVALRQWAEKRQAQDKDEQLA